MDSDRITAALLEGIIWVEPKPASDHKATASAGGERGNLD